MKKNKEINLSSLNKHRARLMVNYFFNRKYYIGSAILLGFLALLCGAGAIIFETEVLKDFGQRTLMHILLAVGFLFCTLFTILFIIKLFANFIDHTTLEAIIGRDRAKAMDGLFGHLAIENDSKQYIETPIELVSPEMYPGRNKTLYRYEKKAKKIYYSQTGYTWVLFGENNLFLYHVAVNHVNGFVGFEDACEVAYSDIVNVRTSVTREKTFEFLKMNLSLVDGHSLEITIRGRKIFLLNGQFDDSTYPITDSEALIVERIRKVIRSHK